ncbi:MAG TPA: hypothetical protein VGP76_25925 [Planctomycetaceae bacterium]|nr:hypothetical protein [Planctomycetaceae bacterium]
MKRDDPSATYRGYRRQALYTLSRLFDEALGEDLIVQPEGAEDLAIFDKRGDLIEVVQVKDHSSNLTASSFKPFFYERISGYCAPGSRVAVRVASFGPIGPELEAAQKGDSRAKAQIVKAIARPTRAKRTKEDGPPEATGEPDLSPSQATQIVERLIFEPVTEGALTQRILESLAASVVGVSPRDGFDLLMWWMLTSAESQHLITRQDALKKLTHVGKFLEGRAAFGAEWFRSIVPLDDSALPTTETQDKLVDEFYRGARVRFEHIVADVDVHRSEPLTQIHQLFFLSNVVVIHSASGQGKTTLALRYLKELAPASFRLQIHAAESLTHARQMAFAIREHTDAIAVPTLVFVDVRPGDGHWVEVVRELLSQPLIRVLVAIREEDWQRANVSAADFLFSEMDLTFDEEEGRSIYSSLRERQLATRHIDFEEAWSRFGSRKTLLEFVYFVTQSETLANRIKSQVTAFQEEVRSGRATSNEESLLRLVGVASEYEARLDLMRTMEECGIASPTATLRRFEDEYLIRTSDDGRLLDGFHAIRSGILTECLTDPCLFNWGKIAARAIPLIDEGDLEAFLLCAFSRRQGATHTLLDALQGFEPVTWLGVCGVLKALMWLGLYEYWNENRALVDEVFAENSDGWYLLLDWDVVRVAGTRGFNAFKYLGPDWSHAAARSEQLRARQTDVSRIFYHARDWFNSRQGLAAEPTEERDWTSLSEVMFWCGHLRISSPLASKIRSETISVATERLPLYRVAEFMRGVREASPAIVQAWLKDHRGAFLDSVRRQAGIAKLDETDDAIVAHYLINLDSEASRLRPESKSELKRTSAEDLTAERVELLSQLIEGKQRYGAVGYGHRLSFLTLPFDDANKPGVEASHLVPIWAVRFNSLSRGHAENRFRPDDWETFFSKLAAFREQFLLALSALQDALKRSRVSSGSLRFPRAKEWDDCRGLFKETVLFPKCAVDEWGYFSESTVLSETISGRIGPQASAARFKKFGKAIRSFLAAGSCFLRQAWDALILAPALHAAKSDAHRKEIIGSAERLGISLSSIRLSVINGCDAYAAIREIHSAFDEVGSLARWRNLELESREEREYLRTMDEWASFLFPPNKIQKSASHRREPFGWALRPIRNRLKNNLQSLRAHGIVAKVLPDRAVWDGKIGLWIQADVPHPVMGIRALALIWTGVWNAFGQHSENPVPYCATEIAWKEIVVAITVNSRSLDRRALRHFKAAAFQKDASLENREWALVPETVPPSVWDQIGIECWEPFVQMAAMDQFNASFGALLQHVEHMADFRRLPDTDELGFSILQEYLNRESKRAEPMVQAAYDAFAEVLDFAQSLGELNESPNLVASLQALVALKDAIHARPSQLGQSNQLAAHRYSLDEIVDWRDRLCSGFELIAQARLFWAAHLLGCPQLRD